MFTFLHTFAAESGNRHRRCRLGLISLKALASAMVEVAGATADIAKRTACRPRLKARVYVIGSEPNGYPEKALTYVAIRLTNISKLPLCVTSMFVLWQLPFLRRSNISLAVGERGDGVTNQLAFPITLPPHTSETVCLIGIAAFRIEMSRVLDSGRLGRMLAAMLLQGTMETEGGARFRLTSDNSFRTELAQLANKPVQVNQPKPPPDNAGR